MKLFTMRYIVGLFTVVFCGTGQGMSPLRLEPPGVFRAFFTSDNFIVTCLACHECRATRLTWQSPSGADIINTRGRVHVEPSAHNPLGLELVVEDVLRQDEGSYTCSAVVDGLEVRTKLTIVIYQSITFYGTSAEQHGIEGYDYLIRCGIRSEPQAIVHWYVNGTFIMNGPRFTVTEDGLFIRKLKRSDSSNYTCRAFVITSHSSQMKDLQIRFDVHYRPVWRNMNTETTYGILYGMGHLICEAHAQPPPVFEWFRDMTLLGNNHIYRITNYKWKSILQVKINKAVAFGSYQCVVSNNLGQIRREIILTEGAYPGRPSVTTYSLEPGAILVRMKPFPTDRLPVLGYRIQCKLKSVFGWNNVNEYYVYKQEDFVLQDLDFETEYSIRIRARNAIGYSNYSEEVHQITRNIIAETVVEGHAISTAANFSLSSSCFETPTINPKVLSIMQVYIIIHLIETKIV